MIKRIYICLKVIAISQELTVHTHGRSVVAAGHREIFISMSLTLSISTFAATEFLILKLYQGINDQINGDFICEKFQKFQNNYSSFNLSSDGICIFRIKWEKWGISTFSNILKWGISKNWHLKRFRTETGEKLKVFEFGAFQTVMNMSSREKYMIYWISFTCFLGHYMLLPY